MNKIFIVLTKRWGVDLKKRKGVSADAVVDFEKENKIVIPDDMREFYVDVNGMTVDEWNFDENAHEVKFLPMHKLESKPVTFMENYFNSSEKFKYYLFAGTGDYDCLIFHEFVIRLSLDKDYDNLVYLLNEMGETDLIAHSFTDFVRKCFYYSLGDPRLTPIQSKQRLQELEEFYKNNIGKNNKWWKF